MKHINYQTNNTCSRSISFDITDEGKIRNIIFVGGCNGNLKAISKLAEGQDARFIANVFAGNTCGYKNTSCADQLSQAILNALK